MVASNTVQTDTLADVKDEAKPFNAKLRRVLNDKSAKDLADLLNVKTQTVYQWKLRGFQLAPYQVPIVAKFAGCSVDYLCDNSIPVEADPKQGTGSARLTDAELVVRLRSRYIEEAHRAHDYLDEIQGVQWLEVARRLLDLDVSEPLPPDLTRAAQLVDFLPSLFMHTVGPFSAVFNPQGIPDRLQPEAIDKRIKAIGYANSYRMVADVLPIRRGLAIAARHPERKFDLTGSKRLLDEVRLEIVHLDESGLYLTDTYWGVCETGSVDAYITSILARTKELVLSNAEDAPADPAAIAQRVIETCKDTIGADVSKQIEYERMADQAWRGDHLNATGEFVEMSKEAEQAMLDRNFLRAEIFNRACMESKGKIKKL